MPSRKNEDIIQQRELVEPKKRALFNVPPPTEVQVRKNKPSRKRRRRKRRFSRLYDRRRRPRRARRASSSRQLQPEPVQLATKTEEMKIGEN